MARTKIAIEVKRDGVTQAIKTAARQQMREQGTASISLRGIARELDITAPALYRYYPDRNTLITDLILDAFNGLADAVETADQAVNPIHYAERMFAAVIAYRQWAVDHAVDYLLIYGTPIPGYEAPREQTVPAMQRTVLPFGGILYDASKAGILNIPPEALIDDPEIRAHFEEIARTDDVQVPYLIVSITIDLWYRLYGLVMLEILGHSPPTVKKAREFYLIKIRQMLKDMNLLPDNF